MSGLIKTNIVTSKVLAEGLKKIVKLEGVDEKKEPYEKTKKNYERGSSSFEFRSKTESSKVPIGFLNQPIS